MSCCTDASRQSSDQEKISLIQGGGTAKMQTGDGYEFEPRQRGFFCAICECCADMTSAQVRNQFRLMMWRNALIKRRRLGELIKGWILPVLVFLVIYLLYLEFPEVIGAVKIVEEKVRKYEDDARYEGISDADDLFGGGDDDFLFNKIQREVIDISLNSYLEQVGVPIAFLQLQWSLITLVVLERENRVKEMMLMMGLREPAYWLSMFSTEFLSCAVLCVFLGAASAQWGLFHEGGFGPVAALLFCYSLGTISFLYFVASFFKSAQSAAQLTSLAMVASILAFVAGSMEELSPLWEAVWCLVPPVALQYGILGFFPSNAELGLPICVDTCPDTHKWCSHEQNPKQSCGDEGKKRDHDYCDFDEDCCGDGHCDSDTLIYHGCVIMLHKINCVTQAQFDQTTLPLGVVNAMLCLDAVLYAALTGLAIKYDWSLGGGVSALFGWCANLANFRKRMDGYQVVGVHDDDEDAEDGEGGGGGGGGQGASSAVEGKGKGGGGLGGRQFHPEGYVKEKSSGRHRTTVRVVGLFKSFSGGRMGTSFGSLFSGGIGGSWFGWRRGDEAGEGSSSSSPPSSKPSAPPPPALNRTCLTLKESELTVLMGQNGAGKTSLISCLTGRLLADSGRAEVFGHDANDWRGSGGGGGSGAGSVGGGGMPAIRQSLGVCPQEDALFEGFTPKEMLQFYAALKGVEPEKQKQAVQSMLVDMGLLLQSPSSSPADETAEGGGSGDKKLVSPPSSSSSSSSSKREPANMFVGELSGGQRRRVSIGIALIGDSKFVVLDEPTSAMDPLGKHQVWALLRKLVARGSGRTMLLTTHLMDEADAVADTVAVMVAGRVHCTGSPAFLKRHLGAGYTLTLAQQPAAAATAATAETTLTTAHSSSSTLPLPHTSSHSTGGGGGSSSSSGGGGALSGTPHPKLRSLANWVRAQLAAAGQKGGGALTRQTRDQIHMTLPFDVPLAAFFRNLDNHLVATSNSHVQQGSCLQKEEGSNGDRSLLERSSSGRDGGGGGGAGAVVSYGVEMPSLESVFLRVTAKALGLPNPEDQDEIVYDDDELVKSEASVAGHGNGKVATLADWDKENPGLLLNGDGTNGQRQQRCWSSLDTTLRQAWALAKFRLHISFTGQPLATLGIVLPSSVASFLACAVLGSIHSLGTEARGAVVAAMMVSGIFLPGISASALLKEREQGLRHLLAVSGCGLRSFWLGTWLAEVVSVQLFPTVTLWFFAHFFEVKGWPYEPWFYATTLAFAGHQTLFSFALSFAFPSSTSASLFAPGVVLVCTMLAPSLAVLGGAYVLSDDVKTSLFGWLPFSLGGTLAYSVGLCSPILLAWIGLANLTAPFDIDPPPSAPATVAMQLLLSLALALCVLALESGYTNVVTPPGRNGASAGNPTVGGGDDDEEDDDEEDDDEDVVAERARAYASASDPTALLRLVALRKEFPKSKTGGLAVAAGGGAADSGNCCTFGDGEVAPAAVSSEEDVEKNLRTSASPAPPAGKQKASSKVRVAVKNMSLVASRGECVGLLGPNGAGKSTTIAMLSRGVTPTEGDASLCGHSVLRSAPRAFTHLGLVPQDMDTLWAAATVDAHVALFQNLRGVVHKGGDEHNGGGSGGPEERIGMDRSVLGAVRLGGLADRCKRAGDLSGGMRRRLSTALALVGSPSVVVLDEPTAGLDPLSRRHVWDALRRTMAHDKLCVLLTTHSLDEAEALCHRLGIVVDGALKCLGSPLHLKTKYGRGYEVSVRISAAAASEGGRKRGGGGGDGGGGEFGSDHEEEDEEEDDGSSVGCGVQGGGGRGAQELTSALRVAAAIKTLTTAFPSSRVLEKHDNRFRVLVPKADMNLPTVFDLLESICSASNGSSAGHNTAPSMQSFYCVNLSSIEQVFLDVVQGDSGGSSSDPNPFT